ncbi:tRNA synthetases class I (M)-domain-containing protein [Polychytrium aggregatum]|uniref:tRNA synthetases class I (M)-domain-containing protein n=1 Tax=Polychytrium aggregatum TaxID=110093 RepID=UPI0022FE29F4|nr:tRNA synthetases class I (M)-domain-containing protein [Polychytrium aggregatum]KAI9202586.1 tRNA synthetases class I (M)-domain-containing protein [Polychytrium aggregatum]
MLSIAFARRSLQSLTGRNGAARLLSTSQSSLASYGFVTSPIYYVNADPHIGHLYTTVLADTIKRYSELKGVSTIYSTGTDEHGLKIQQAAAKAGTSPQQFCDQISTRFQRLFDRSSVSYTDYIRTTEERHVRAVQHLWTVLYDNGYIYKGHHEGWYCVSDETFYPENQVEEATDAHGKKKMISKESGKDVEWTREENYKFRLSEFREKLIAWMKQDPSVIVPSSQYNIIMSILESKDGLPDLSVSRLRSKLQWGISVPNDPDHVVYVWLDALTNYLTVAGYPWASTASTDDRMWPPTVHVVGKDIIKFHAIYWPAFLMAADLPLPKRIVSHAHWIVGSQKMSKSLGNVVDPVKMTEKYGVDPTRFYLMQIGSIENDSVFDETALEATYNSLANGLGNLMMRAMTPKTNIWMAIPTRASVDVDPDASEQQLIDAIEEARLIFNKSMDDVAFPKALDAVNQLIAQVNHFWDRSTPWKVAKAKTPESEQHLRHILYYTFEGLRNIGIMVQPFMPTKGSQILDALKVDATERGWANCGVGKRWRESGHDHPAEIPIERASPLFPREK